MEAVGSLLFFFSLFFGGGALPNKFLEKLDLEEVLADPSLVAVFFWVFWGACPGSSSRGVQVQARRHHRGAGGARHTALRRRWRPLIVLHGGGPSSIFFLTG